MIEKSEQEKLNNNDNNNNNNNQNNDENIITDSQTGEIYHYASFNKHSYKIEENDEEDQNRMSKKFIDKLLCSDFKMYYRTYELNEILYLHFKSFKKIENLTYFTNLKVLYLEGNLISKIEGLETLTNLTSLYLHENCIEKIEGLETLKNLCNLNLSDNCITKIENLNSCIKLQNLLIKRNRIGINGESDLNGLLNLNNEFTVLDISDNKIEDSDIIEKFLVKIPNLRVIYLQGNECCRKIKNYRKTLINKLKELRYIDDRPVFEDERRFAEAFGRGGYEEEKKERERYRQEIKEKEEKRIKDFYEMVNKFKKDREGENNNEEEKQKKSLTEEEREKKKMELLKKLKEKNNNIFSEHDVGNMPHVKAKDMEKDLNENEKKNDNNNNNNKNDDEQMPELEEVKIEEKKNQEIIEEIDTSSKNKNVSLNNNKFEEEKNNSKEENEKNKGVKIEVKESNLDELD